MARAIVRYSPGLVGRMHERAAEATGPNMRKRGILVESASKRRISANPRRVDTGRLRASIHITMLRFRGAWGVQVGTSVEYALYVHNGTRYMIANPYLRDGLQAARL